MLNTCVCLSTHFNLLAELSEGLCGAESQFTHKAVCTHTEGQNDHILTLPQANVPAVWVQLLWMGTWAPLGLDGGAVIIKLPCTCPSLSQRVKTQYCRYLTHLCQRLSPTNIWSERKCAQDLVWKTKYRRSLLSDAVTF